VRPELEELVLGDRPEAWEALGFTTSGGVAVVGGIRIRLSGRGGGILGWGLRGLAADADLDGLPHSVSSGGPGRPPVAHPIGATEVDHLVALTPDLERTCGRLRAAGFDYRRTRDAGSGFRQAFFVIGSCLLELGGPAEADAPKLWGLTLVVEDLDAAAGLLGSRLGRIKEAVQRGRRIATVRPEAGLGIPLALMTPR
jgi:hypothetical protein